MNVYLVRQESGQYSDWMSVIERVYATREAAVAYVESIECSYERCVDYDRCDYDDAWEVVTETPVRHPSNYGECWYVEGDRDCDGPCWFIDEMEVME